MVAGQKMQCCNSGMCGMKPACVQLRLHVLHLLQTCRQDLMRLRTAATTVLFLLSNPKALLPHQHPCPADKQMKAILPAELWWSTGGMLGQDSLPGIQQVLFWVTAESLNVCAVLSEH